MLLFTLLCLLSIKSCCGKPCKFGRRKSVSVHTFQLNDIECIFRHFDVYTNACTGHCWEADRTKFGCVNYEMCGFTCSHTDNWCAFQGDTCLCGGTECQICAKRIPNAILDMNTSRCITVSERPTITPDFLLSVECLRMCVDGYDEYIPEAYDCPSLQGSCCDWQQSEFFKWEQSGITCDDSNKNVVELNFIENLAFAQQSAVLYGTFPDFLHTMKTLKRIYFVGGNLTGTLSESLGFVDCTARFPPISHKLRQTRTLGLEELQIARVGSITGTIPSTFEQLQELQFMVCGHFTPVFISSIYTYVRVSECLAHGVRARILTGLER